MKCEQTSRLFAETRLAAFPLNARALSAAQLNIEEKQRSNLLAWNGQFSPQFVEVMIRTYSSAGQTVLDPFCGSGTVLGECAALGRPVHGVELNPAAYYLSRFYRLCNLPLAQRLSDIRGVEKSLARLADDGLLISSDDGYALDAEGVARLRRGLTEWQTEILETFLVLSNAAKSGKKERFHRVWARLRENALSLPVATHLVSVEQGDARNAAAPVLASLVFTSPPYINVYNYHQQYRETAEVLGWNLLEVAKTEFGSNRKNRGNRLLTVVQYCLDMAQCLVSLRQSTQAGGRLIFVLGRESRVRGLPFFNGSICADIGERCAGLEVVDRQERVFTNRFGQEITEDILHFSIRPESPRASFLSEARTIAQEHLGIAARLAEADELLGDIHDALSRIDLVAPSPRPNFSRSK